MGGKVRIRYGKTGPGLATLSNSAVVSEPAYSESDHDGAGMADSPPSSHVSDSLPPVLSEIPQISNAAAIRGSNPDGASLRAFIAAEGLRGCVIILTIRAHSCPIGGNSC